MMEGASQTTGTEKKKKKPKKKSIIIICVLVAVIVVAAFIYSALKEKIAIQEISTEAEFIEFFENGFPDKTPGDEATTYILENDIVITKNDLQNKDMKEYADKIASGNYSEKEARMTLGSNDTIIFDGKGYTIKNLTLTGYCASLFGRVGTQASSSDGNIVIKNVTFDNLTINGIGSTGALISYLNEDATATFENVKIINSVITCEEDAAVGGLIGSVNEGTVFIKDCSIENSTITAANATNVGGIVGSVCNHANPAKISDIGNCKNINTEVTGYKNVGGIIGEYKDNWFSGKDAQGNEVDEECIVFKGLESSGKIYAPNENVGAIIGNLSHGNDLSITFENCKTNIGANPSISGKNNVGGIVGATSYNRDGFVAATGSQITFKNCDNNQMIFGGENVGGIVGYINNKFWDVKFIDSGNHRNINGKDHVGGIAGAIAGTIFGGKQFSFTNCKNEANIIGTEADSSYIGGILGYNDNLNPLFTNCKNLGANNLAMKGKSYVGGISGRYGTFVDCENTMDIKSDTQLSWEYIGGIVGSGEGSTFTNCSNSGNIIDYGNVESKTNVVSVTAIHIGGIAGFTNQLVMSGCSNTGTISGTAYVGGLVGKTTTTIVIGPANKLINCSNNGNIYALGQSSTTEENYTNDDIDDVSGKIGAIIGYFDTGMRIVQFDNVTANVNIYIVNDTDYVGGWCGYCAESGGEAIKNGNTNSNISYNIYFNSNEQNVSSICKENMHYGEDCFPERIEGFNEPTTIDGFTYVK